MKDHNSIEEIISEIHKKQLLMMKQVLPLLEKNGIAYYLAFGTFLGAVRHSGFIPWDDDVDIQILHKDYARFIKICKRYLDSDVYEMHSSEDKGISSIYTKIYLKNTFIPTLYNDESSIDDNDGIWLDFFDVIFAAASEKWLNIQLSMIRSVQRIKTRYLAYKGDNIIKKYINEIVNSGIHILSKIVLFFARCIGGMSNHKEVINLGSMFYEPVSIEVYKGKGMILSAEYFKNRKKYKFENDSFYGVEDYDGYLSACYTSNYMIPVRYNSHITDYSKVRL